MSASIGLGNYSKKKKKSMQELSVIIGSAQSLMIF